MSTTDNKRFRVVVVGVADGHDMSPRDLAGSLTEYFPLAPDAQVAIESGRSAVVQVAESEHVARKAATMLIKLGAEIRIEPDSATAPNGGGPLDFDDISFDELDDGLGALELEDSLGPVKADPVIVDRPPVVDEDAETLPPQPSVRRRKDRTTRELEPIETASARPSAPRDGPETAVAPPEVPDAPPQAMDAAPDEAPPPDDATAARSGSRVRCPAHGLLYDPNESPGCSRCLGPSAEQPFRLAPELRRRPRLWLTLGLTLGLLLGAVPAALYAQDVKASALYERRIEADVIRRTRADSKHFKKQYAKARAKIDATRNRGIAISALIWIGIAAALMLLWYRFV